MKHIEFEEIELPTPVKKPGFIFNLKEKFGKKKKIVDPNPIPDTVIDPIKKTLEDEIPHVDIDEILKRYRFYEPNVLISESAISMTPKKVEPTPPVKLDPVPIVVKPKRDWRVFINMFIGGAAILLCGYGALLINNQLANRPILIAGILLVCISSSIIINLIRSF